MTLQRIGGLETYDVVHHEVQYACPCGCYTRTKYWLKGHHPQLPRVRLIQGTSGPESEFISEETRRGHV